MLRMTPLCKLRFMFCMVLAIISCSRSDNEDAENVSKIEVDTNTFREYDGIGINFQLLNSDSIPVKSFSLGENVFFKLSITNNRKDIAELSSSVELANDIFHVYSADGKDIGTPWDTYLIMGPAALEISPGTTIVFSCAWAGEVEEPPYDEILRKSKLHLLKTKARSTLPKGEYKCKFDIPLEKGRTITCNKEFKVK